MAADGVKTVASGVASPCAESGESDSFIRNDGDNVSANPDRRDLNRDVSAASDTGSLKIAYADPPYPGCAHLYEGHEDYAGEVDHRDLVMQLEGLYDGWCLHTSSVALEDVLAHLAAVGATDYRVMAWVKPFAAFKRNVSVAYAWEPVIVKAARKPTVKPGMTYRDWIAEPITLKRGLTGAKPEAVCRWLFEVMGCEPQDELVDLYPGTGAVTTSSTSASGRSGRMSKGLQRGPHRDEQTASAQGARRMPDLRAATGRAGGHGETDAPAHRGSAATDTPESLTEEGGVNESSSGVHGQQMSPLRSPGNDRSGRSSASTSPPAASDSLAAVVQDPDTGEWFDPYRDDFGNELDCTHCGGEGTCDDNANPLWDCDDNLHPCHACGGSGLRRDQRVF